MQCAGGLEPSTATPEACLASCALPRRLDDGAPHTCRVLLLPNRFGASPPPRTTTTADGDDPLAESGGAPPDGASGGAGGAGGGGGGGGSGTAASHRLLVFVDEMTRALINVEVSLPQLLRDAPGFTARGGAEAGRMVAGFTAGCGARHASHRITSWRFTEVVRGKQAEAGGSWLARARNLIG